MTTKYSERNNYNNKEGWFIKTLKYEQKSNEIIHIENKFNVLNLLIWAIIVRYATMYR